jgi:hypothetical protein
VLSRDFQRVCCPGDCLFLRTEPCSICTTSRVQCEPCSTFRRPISLSSKWSSSAHADEARAHNSPMLCTQTMSLFIKRMSFFTTLGNMDQHYPQGTKQVLTLRIVEVLHEYSYTLQLQLYLKTLFTRYCMEPCSSFANKARRFFAATSENVVTIHFLCSSKEGGLKSPLHALGTRFKRARRGGGAFIMRVRH